MATLAPTCLDPSDVLLQAGYLGSFSGREATEHFDLAYDPDDPALDGATLQALGDALEQAWQVEVVELGWPVPPGADALRVLAIAYDFPDGSPGGLAALSLCPDGSYASHLIVNTDFFAVDPDYVLDLTAHEFAHDVQHATAGSDAYLADPESRWVVEASAVWMQDQVHPNTNRWVGDFATRYLRSPQTALDSVEDRIDYGHALFLQYFDEHVGGPDLVRRLWTEAGPQDHVLSVANRLLTDEDGSGFLQHFADFLAHTAALDYDDRPLLDDWNRALEAEEGVSMYREALDALPASGSYERALPEKFGANYVAVTFPALDPGDSIAVHLHGDGDADANPWAFGAAVSGPGGLATASALSDASGDAVLTLPAGGATALWIGAGPTGTATAGSAWSWDADRAAGATSTGASPTTGGPRDDAGCGCDEPGPSPLSWFGLPMALLARWRRSVLRR